VEQMTYLFYPYFWAAKTTGFPYRPCSTMIHCSRASCRPGGPGSRAVHSAYNDAILYYLQTGIYGTEAIRQSSMIRCTLRFMRS